MSGKWSYAALNPDPGKQRGREQKMVCKTFLALRDHGERFYQAMRRFPEIPHWRAAAGEKEGPQERRQHRG
jgi:hypothetical protein